MRSSFSRKEFRHSILGSGRNSGYTNLELDGTTDFLSGFACFSGTALSSEGCCTSDTGVLLVDLDTWKTSVKTNCLSISWVSRKANININNTRHMPGAQLTKSSQHD